MVYDKLQKILTKLELQLNEEKTQLKNARLESFDFLGFSIRMSRAKQSGKCFPCVEPSDKAMQSIKQKIKYYTRREMNPVPIDGIVVKLNQSVRGWSNYFYYGHGHRKMKQIKYYLGESLRLHLRYRHKLKNRGAAYDRFPYSYLHNYLGLYKVPTSPTWKSTHAQGRRTSESRMRRMRTSQPRVRFDEGRLCPFLIRKGHSLLL